MSYWEAFVDRSSLVEQTTPSAVVIIDAAWTMGPFFAFFSCVVMFVSKYKDMEQTWTSGIRLKQRF